MKHKLKTCIGALAFIALPAMGQQYPYQNPKLTPEERAEDLIGRLTLEEKAYAKLLSCHSSFRHQGI